MTVLNEGVLASARLNKLCIVFSNNLLDGGLSVPYLLFLWFSNIILSHASILPVSWIKTRQVITSLIRSRMEYLIQTRHILVLIL